MVLLDIRILLVTLAIMLVCIALAKELKNPYIVIGVLVFSVVLLINSYLSLDLVHSALRYKIYMSISIEYFLIFMSYITYLWIDDINARSLNLKTYDDSLVWLWGEEPRINKKKSKKENKKEIKEK